MEKLGSLTNAPSFKSSTEIELISHIYSRHYLGKIILCPSVIKAISWESFYTYWRLLMLFARLINSSVYVPSTVVETKLDC